MQCETDGHRLRPGLGFLAWSFVGSLAVEAAGGAARPHSDLSALSRSGPREPDLLRRAGESPSQLVHPKQFRAPLGPSATLLPAGGNHADQQKRLSLSPLPRVARPSGS
jgi:hypothetical protein